MQENNLFDDRALQAVQEELQTRLMHWYIDTTGVPPPERDPSGAPVLDRLPELQHAPPSSDLLDH